MRPLEKDSRTPSKKPRQPSGDSGRRSSAVLTWCTVGVGTASPVDIVRPWNDYLEDLLNPTDTPSAEEAESWSSWTPLQWVLDSALAALCHQLCP